MKNIKKRIWGGDDFFGPKHIFRQKKILSLLKKNIKTGHILDAGCGKGDVSLILLKQGFDITAVDVTDENINFLKDRVQKSKLFNKIKIIKSELENLKLEKESLDGIVCGEVLEHVRDDDKTLKNFNTFLKKGGHCIITTPLNKKFWTVDDEWAGHYRRYSLDSFKKLIEKNGFTIEKIKFYGPLFNLYYFQIYLRILRRKLKKSNSGSTYKNNFLSKLKTLASYFYILFYIDDIIRYPAEKSLYLLADIKKVREI